MKGIYAANRFGFGLRPEQSTVPDDKSVQWLVEQLSINLQSELDQSLPTSGQIMQQQKAYRMARKQAKMDGEVLKNDKPRKVFTTLVSDTFNASLKSANPFTWRLLDFFSNHFSVSAKGPVMVSLSATLEREAIMPNLSGRFEDLLLAVIKHPAMLIYLNNERSFGNNSLTSGIPYSPSRIVCVQIVIIICLMCRPLCNDVWTYICDYISIAGNC